jgi:hypothetical protein
MSDASTAQVAVGSKSQKVGDPVSWGAASSPGIDGVCPQRVDARFHRFKQTTTAGDTNFTRSVGLELDLQEAGER